MLRSVAPRTGDPMSELKCRVQRGPDVTTIFVAGLLSLRTAPSVRSTVLRCLADCPAAVIVDLSDMMSESDVPLTIFPAMKRRAAQWPGIPVLVCAPTPAVEQRLSRAFGLHLAIYATRAQAVAALGKPAATGRRTILDLPTSRA